MALRLEADRRGSLPDFGGEWEQSAHRVGRAAEQRREQIDTIGHLPTELVSVLQDDGLFKLLLPDRLGGNSGTVHDLIDVVSIVASYDASTAWCLGQAIGCSMVAGSLDETVAREIFMPNDAVIAWGPDPKSQAVECGGGYLVSGCFAFASGSSHATWLGAHTRVVDDDGNPRLDADGKSIVRTFLFPRSEVTLEDVWSGVIGLRGSASNTYRIDKLFVPSKHSVNRLTDSRASPLGAVFSFPPNMIYAIAFSAVAYGLSRRMLDDFVKLAKVKIPRGQAKLSGDPLTQVEIGQLEADLRSSIAYLREAADKAWRRAHRDGSITMDDRIETRLAASNLTLRSRGVAQSVYHAAGATAIFESAPFAHRFRDAHAVSQQLQGRISHYETVGRHALGLEIDNTYV